MRIHLLLYWFLAASKLDRAGCDQQLLGIEDARDDASEGAKSICYTYITTILVTITADVSDTRDDTTAQRFSSAFYYPDSQVRQTQTRTPGQAGNDLSSFGTSEPPGNGMSNNLNPSMIPTPDATSVAKTGDESDAFPSAGKTSDIPSTNPPDTSRGELASTADTETGPYGADTPSDASLGRDPTAPTSAAGAIPTTTPGQTSGMDDDGAGNIGQDSTALGGGGTPRPPGGPGDASSSLFATTLGTTGPTVLNPSMASRTSKTNPTDVIMPTTEEGPATTYVGTSFPASTKMPGSETPSQKPTDPVPTSQAPTEATSNQPASMTTQGPSSATASQVILSIEAIASFGPASQTPRVRPRGELGKRDEDPGFVGDSRDPNPDSCSNAVRFRQSNGQLQRRGRPVSVDPGVDYIDLADYPGGSISTLFSVVDDRLQWDNEAFSGGRAAFCQVGNETVYAVFIKDGGPRDCSPVVLVVYKGRYWDRRDRFSGLSNPIHSKSHIAVGNPWQLRPLWSYGHFLLDRSGQQQWDEQHG
ncbi:hypothetical protein PG991_006119 [Apiospora marii]|uniref:DUF7908 domain-containing protein n=1 Tax=Apiospora marii TaxID=335849 RepID=A0ABR1SB56_9PEZI